MDRSPVLRDPQLRVVGVIGYCDSLIGRSQPTRFPLKMACVHAAISFAYLPPSHCCVYWIHCGRLGDLGLSVAEAQYSIPKRRRGWPSRVGWILHRMVCCFLGSLAKYHHLLRRQDAGNLHDEPLPASVLSGVRCCDASSYPEPNFVPTEALQGRVRRKPLSR